MWMAKAKQATTTAAQTAFIALDLAVEMRPRPWIVELSRNSLSSFDFILNPDNGMFEGDSAV